MTKTEAARVRVWAPMSIILPALLLCDAMGTERPKQDLAQKETQPDLRETRLALERARRLSPRDRDIANELTAVTIRIDLEVTSLANKAIRAQNNGRLTEAHRAYERILELKPSHPQALAALRAKHRADALKRIARTNSQVMAATAPPPPLPVEQPAPDKQPVTIEIHLTTVEAISAVKANVIKAVANEDFDDARAELLRWEALNLSEKQGKALLRERFRLADKLFAQGLDIYETDIDAAIGKWEAALKIDPTYSRARQYLEEATVLKAALASN